MICKALSECPLRRPEHDAMFLQLLPVHHEVSDKVRFFDAHIYLEQVCEIQRSIDHILVVPAAEVVDAAGSAIAGRRFAMTSRT